MKRGLLLCAVMILSSPVACAAQAVQGSTSGIFDNPVPDGGSPDFGGVGTNNFTWGTPATSSDFSNVLNFGGSTINSTSGAMFSVGALTYTNGTTLQGTNATSVDLDLNVDLTLPGALNTTIPETFDLVSTPNTGNAMQNADYVFLPTLFNPIQISAGGFNYTFSLDGFFNASAGGFTGPLNQFDVEEGDTASADLLATVTVSTPEPGAIGLGAAAASALGSPLLAGFRRRRRR